MITTQINFRKIKCPICQQQGKIIHYFEEIQCECGYIHYTPYPYVAGKKINMNIPKEEK